MLADHPGPDELQAYGQGRLTSEACRSLEAHLAGCVRCCELLEQAPGDSFLGRLRTAGSSAPPGPVPTPDTDLLEVPAGSVPAVPPELVNHPRYRVLGLIGQGGMGAVYRAEHRRMARLVALKVIRPDLVRNRAAVQRFHQEVRAAARLQHPNIVTAFDADQAGGLHFLVMEHVEGISLAELVRRQGPLSVAEACSYARQAALGLQHAHEQGMVHRDVKPQNLMLTSKGQVKILDFGLARLPRTPDAPPTGMAPAKSLTGIGTVMGTVDYIAPEQAADPRSADIRADIYSLGCTLFHLLTGRLPFPGGGATAKLARHADTPLPALDNVRPAVPPRLAAVLARMTAKNPARRYATPADVAQALAPFSSPGEVHPPRPRKRRGWLAAAVLLLAGTLLAGALLLRANPEPPRDPGEAHGDPEPPRVKGPEPARQEKAPPKAELTEEQAAEAVNKLGGRITRNEQDPGKPVIFVQFAGVPVADDDIRALAAFKGLQSLDLSRTAVTDAGMKQVGELKKLNLLDLQFTDVGNAGVKHLAGLADLRILSLYGTRVTDDGMADVGRLPKLFLLHLENTAITDAGLEKLTGLGELNSLGLFQVPGVTDKGMKSVARLAKLASLDLRGTQVTDEGLKDLAGQGQLTSLEIGGLKVTDAGVKALAPLTGLRVLDLSLTDVTDAGLKALAGHRDLTNLNLQGARKMTDAGLKELAALPQLQFLSLAETDVTDAGLKELARCPRLATLNLRGADKVTDAGVAELQRALAQLRIDR
jgi:serine/threonine protein kinase